MLKVFPVLLKTEAKNGILGRFVDTNKLIIRSSDDIPRGEDVHLYLCVDEKPTGGDVGMVHPTGVYDRENDVMVGNNPFLFVHNNTPVDKLDTLTERTLKVIATTDESLGLPAIQEHVLENLVEYYYDNEELPVYFQYALDEKIFKDMLTNKYFQAFDGFNDSMWGEGKLNHRKWGFLEGVEYIIEDLEMLISHNEDDFDRGGGKYILEQFINKLKNKL